MKRKKKRQLPEIKNFRAVAFFVYFNQINFKKADEEYVAHCSGKK